MIRRKIKIYTHHGIYHEALAPKPAMKTVLAQVLLFVPRLGYEICFQVGLTLISLPKTVTNLFYGSKKLSRQAQYKLRDRKSVV